MRKSEKEIKRWQIEKVKEKILSDILLHTYILQYYE